MSQSILSPNYRLIAGKTGFCSFNKATSPGEGNPELKPAVLSKKIAVVSVYSIQALQDNNGNCSMRVKSCPLKMEQWKPDKLGGIGVLKIRDYTNIDKEVLVKSADEDAE